MSGDMLPETAEADPFDQSLRSIPCPRCGETFMREEDLHVHLERHRPSPELSKEDREGKVHCPKGCGRWVVESDPDLAAHIELCDGSPPITAKVTKSAYRWWCEEHGFGTNGPKPWGVHKREHHEGKQPAAHVEKKPKEEVMAQVKRLLHGELSRLEVEKGKISAEMIRIQAAIKNLDSKSEVPAEPVA